MRKLRVLQLSHPWLMPPSEGSSEASEKERYQWKTDEDVGHALADLGHEVEALGIEDELRPIQLMVRRFKPHVVFNLVESFAGMSDLDQHVVAYLELLRVPYTGCNPRGLVLSKGKALSKKILAYHRIRTPAFAVFPRHRRVRRPASLKLPVIVKSLYEESSTGISQASVVDTDERLAERVRFIHESVGTDAIAEQYIPGRELYVGVVGNHRLTVLTPWELFFGSMRSGVPAIATERIKKDIDHQEKLGIQSGPAAPLSDEQARQLERVSKRIYRVLGLDGYARIDYRLDAEGRLYFLEANPNAELARGEEFAESAQESGIEYTALIQRIVNLGLSRSRR